MKNTNRHHFMLMLGSIVVVISLILGIWTIESKKIEEPVFLTHYINAVAYEEGEVLFRLHYITNAEDTSVLNSIDFSDFNSVVYSEYEYVQEGQFYTYHNVDLKCNLSPEDKVAISNGGIIKLTTGKAHMNNGSEFNVDFGVITIEKRKESSMNLSGSRSSNSNDNEESFSFYGYDGLVIKSMKTNGIVNISDKIYMHIDDVDNNMTEFQSIKDFNYPVNTGNRVNVEIKSDNLIEENIVYNLRLRFQCETKNGKDAEFTMFISNSADYIDDKVMDKIIKKVKQVKEDE